jgi:membrane protein YdbS with pleckstrin-like domain
MSSVNETERDISNSTRSAVVLVDRPVTRRAAASTLCLTALLCLWTAIFVACLLKRDPGGSSWTWVSGMAVAALFIVIIGSGADFARLSSERYIVTTESIKITSGILRRDARRIPFSSVLDVTANASSSRRLFGLGNITVSIANGNQITFEDVSDSQPRAEILWHLVHKT